VFACQPQPGCGNWVFEGCTFYGNSFSILNPDDVAMSISNTIITANTTGSAVSNGANVTPVCCNFYGNSGGDWVGLEGYPGIDGNISMDPLLCDPELGDFHLGSGSPCAPFSTPNEECDLIGAWPVGCDVSPVTPMSWGQIKSEFR
jgi:hypothetical protein